MLPFPAVSIVDGTAVDGQDYNATTQNFTLASGENATYAVDTIADNTCEIEEEYFTLMIKDSSNALLDAANSTANVTISSDFECGKTLDSVSIDLSTTPTTPLLRCPKIGCSHPFIGWMHRKYHTLRPVKWVTW